MHLKCGQTCKIFSVYYKILYKKQ